MLKQSVHIQSPADIPLSSFEEYVKAVNNSEDPFFQVDEDIVHFNYRFVHDEFQVMFHELDTDVSLDSTWLYQMTTNVRSLYHVNFDFARVGAQCAASVLHLGIYKTCVALRSS